MRPWWPGLLAGAGVRFSGPFSRSFWPEIFKMEDDMEKQKEFAIPDYMDMIKKSWTWAKLTEDEKSAFREVVSKASMYTIKGTYMQRWETLCWLYDAFLSGCGYRHGKFREGVQI